MTYYRDIDRIAVGGFGEVWRALSENGEVVARKYLGIPDRSPLDGWAEYVKAADELRRRFAREVRIQQQLNHVNIIPVLEENLECEKPWFVMPLAKENLRAYLDRHGSLKALTPFRQILSGMQHVHSKGVVHRDLKPENVLICGAGDKLEVRVSDFGHGRLLVPDSTVLTGANQFVGTQWYAAPEQYSDAGKATSRCDIYALGCILYECVTGLRPWPAMEFGGVSQDLGAVIKRATAREPGNRFGSVEELYRAIESFP